MKYRAITRKEAERIGKKTGYPISCGDGKTYYLTNEDESEVWEYDSKKQRDAAITNG